MRGVRHFWRKVPEISKGGWKRRLASQRSFGCPGAIPRKTPEPWVSRRYRLMPMTRTELHRFVDALPDESVPAAAILLRRAQDPVAASLDAAPYDDEELTDEDLLAVKEARSHPGISWSDAEAELNAG